jgi:hypothetical protein
VELIIENTDDLLRPGMTAFARVDFDRRMIGGILFYKLKQALRPELWMLYRMFTTSLLSELALIYFRAGIIPPKVKM